MRNRQFISLQAFSCSFSLCSWNLFRIYCRIEVLQLSLFFYKPEHVFSFLGSKVLDVVFHYLDIPTFSMQRLLWELSKQFTV